MVKILKVIYSLLKLNMSVCTLLIFNNENKIRREGGRALTLTIENFGLEKYMQ